MSLRSFGEDLSFTPRTVEMFFSWQGPFLMQRYTLDTEARTIQVKGKLVNFHDPGFPDYLSFKYSDGPYCVSRSKLYLAHVIQKSDEEAVFAIHEEAD